ncbi:MAG: hypothetical protein UF420_07725 [Ellagibacter isourolithinifaciens]|uniref:hypothetical protein n=1 Tax=Ellagibacter isourolithinifaciens TaxID=2137581 RepID=UPI002E795C3B|nr:hypothetical protein [Ellagibacter isourolithinifaciens]MEE1455162.1 hypothetical protein [Ellagibacter isourolithinifaciens]
MDRLTNKAIVLACCLAAAGDELSGECRDATEIARGTRELALSLAVEHRKERA